MSLNYTYDLMICSLLLLRIFSDRYKLICNTLYDDCQSSQVKSSQQGTSKPSRFIDDDGRDGGRDGWAVWDPFINSCFLSNSFSSPLFYSTNKTDMYDLVLRCRKVFPHAILYESRLKIISKQ